MDLPILFEDERLVAVNKPSGVMAHGDGRSKEETVADWFAKRYPESAMVGEAQRLQDGTEITRPGIVHRLDRETSGVLVLAKTQEAHAMLKSAFQAREAKKTYLAFVYGVPKERKGTIDFPIGRSRKDFRMRSAQPKAKGNLREAVTGYQVLDDIGTHALLACFPQTGRTHQIRVHLKAIHHPVVCDSLYASNHACDLGFDRLGLHAYRLALPGFPVLTAPVPEDLAQGLARFPQSETVIASL